MKASEVIPRGWASLFAPDNPWIALGLDLGTTEKKTSNPSALAVTQQVANTYFVRLLLAWKTKDDQVTRAIVRTVLADLPFGYRARRLCIDATNERFFASQLKRELAGLVTSELVIASEATEYLGQRMNFKTYLGNLLINTMEDGYLALPAERFVQTDFRLVVRDRGTFDADVNEEGQHADCFSATELSLHGLVSKGGPTQAEGARVGAYGSPAAPRERFPMRPEQVQDRPARAGLTMP